jgi:hypothetical protein
LESFAEDGRKPVSTMDPSVQTRNISPLSLESSDQFLIGKAVTYFKVLQQSHIVRYPKWATQLVPVSSLLHEHDLPLSTRF